jgi:pimeloyl-ACP methyl ester carboxylesterase
MMTESALPPHAEELAGAAVWSGTSVRREFGWRTTEDRTVFLMVRNPSPVDNPADRAVVVIVGALGIESQGSSAALDALELTLANSGHVTVRFDPPGMGNAPGLAIDGPDWDDVTKSTADVLAAVSQRWPGHRLVVLGVQLGVAAAVEAIDRLPGSISVASLLAWAPAINGRKFLRNLRMFGAVAQGPPRVGGEVNPFEPAGDTGVLEAGGYAFGSALQRSIGAINLVTQPTPRVGSVFVVERDDIPTAGPWVKALQGGGVSVRTVAPPGTRDARFDDPEKGITPSEVISTICDWIDNVANHETSSSLVESPSGFETETLWLKSYIEFHVGRVLVRETVCIHRVPPLRDFSAASLLVFRSEPSPGPGVVHRFSSAAIITSTGANSSSGPGRMNARLARRLAATGRLVLRYDRRGVGGSDGILLHRDRTAESSVGKVGNSGGINLDPPSDAAPTMSSLAYAPEHLSDLACVVQDLLHADTTDLDLVGTCSGATLAYRFAVSGISSVRIRNLVTINQILWDNEVVDLAAESPLVDAKVAGKLAAALRSPLAWPRLLTTDLDVRQNIVRVARHLKSTLHSPKGSERGALDRNVRRLAVSEIQMTHVFDAEEVGLHYLRERAGEAVEALRRSGALETWTIEGAGHTFGSQYSKRWLEERVAALLRLDVTG